MLRIKIPTIALSIAVFASPAVAQNGVEATPSIVAGDTVRVWAERARLNGIVAELARLNDSGLVLHGQSQGVRTRAHEVVVPVDAVQRLEVLRKEPRSKTRIVTGVVVGALVGAAVGAPMGKIIECGGACDKEGSLKPMVGYSLGAAIGAPIGALLGGVVAGISRPRWEPVTLTRR
jgi:hypothetical protein